MDYEEFLWVIGNDTYDVLRHLYKTGKRTTNKDREIFSELLDSKTVLISHNVKDSSISLSATADEEAYKLYLSDIGSFTSLLFNSVDKLHTKIYSKLLSDKPDVNFGYMYENVAAQLIASNTKLVPM